MKPKIEGVIVAIITPLKDGGSTVDLDALRKYCDFLVGKGVQGLFICGTTGEGPLLSIKERKSVAETVIDQIKGEVFIVVHTGHISTVGTIELTRHAEDIGADCAAIVLPYFYSLDEDALFKHITSIAHAVPQFPLFLYNVPQNTGNNISLKLFARLIKEIDNIAGIKTSNPDLLQFQEYLQLARKRCLMFMGCDGLALASLALGADGLVSGNASAFPEPFVDLYQSFKRGDMKLVRGCQTLINELRLALRDGLYPAFFKKALELRGIKAGDVRPPHRELTTEEVINLTKSLKNLMLI